MAGSAGSRFDSLARELASGELSRRAAIKRFAGIATASALAAPASVLAAAGSERACPPARKCDGRCCPKGMRCRKGRCKCKKGLKKCGKKCVNLQTSVTNCGSCGNECPQAALGTCQAAACEQGTCTTVADDTNVPELPNECTSSGCSNGTPFADPLPAGTVCNGGACDGAGNCDPYVCGDDSRDPGEQCDGDDLGGADCVSLGFAGGGTLGCNNDCTYDTTSCFS